MKKRMLTARAPTTGLHWMILDKNGRIIAIADPPYHCGEGEVELPMPPVAEGSNLLDWVWRDGAWHLEPEPAEVTPDECLPYEALIEALVSLEASLMEVSGKLMELLELLKGGDAP